MALSYFLSFRLAFSQSLALNDLEGGFQESLTVFDSRVQIMYLPKTQMQLVVFLFSQENLFSCFLFFLNKVGSWDFLHARLSSHCKAWSYKKKYKKIKKRLKHTGNPFRKNLQIKGVCFNSRLDKATETVIQRCFVKRYF